MLVNQPLSELKYSERLSFFHCTDDGLGLKVLGGREIPGTNMIGAYIQKIHPSLSMNGEIREGIKAL